MPEGLPGFRGTLHVALHPRGDFLGLADFDLRQRYSSSIQQTPIPTGDIAPSEFFPESMEEGVARFVRQFRVRQAQRGRGGLRAELRSLTAPATLRWLLDLQYEGCIVDREPPNPT